MPPIYHHDHYDYDHSDLVDDDHGDNDDHHDHQYHHDCNFDH